MGSRITVRPTTSVGVIGLIAIISGVVMAVVGVGAWVVVSQQLGSERITVADDAPFLSGARVADPFTAFAQAEVIRDHALDASDGRTYAELEQGDPTRAVVMNASFLRASLFTSVVAFGLSAFVTASGVLFILVGWALRRSAGGPPVVIDTDSAGPIHVQDHRGREARGEFGAPPATDSTVVGGEEQDTQDAPVAEGTSGHNHETLGMAGAPGGAPRATSPGVNDSTDDDEWIPAPPQTVDAPPASQATDAPEPISPPATTQTPAPLRMSRSDRALSQQRSYPADGTPSMTSAIPVVGEPPAQGIPADTSPSGERTHSEPAQGPVAADAPELEPMNEDGQNTPTSHDPDRADATSASPEQSTEPRPITGAVQWGSPKDRLQPKNED